MKADGEYHGVNSINQFTTERNRNYTKLPLLKLPFVAYWK